jgi:glycosyltransferase involved in cell wall biosynthesis
MTPKQWRLAVVVQRYGEEVNGGAELHARWLAEHLTALAEVHAITTCALDATTWANHYAPGESQLNGVSLHRFPVDAPRDWDKAKQHTGRLVTTDHTLFDEFHWMRYDQGPYSTPLFNFIRDSYNHFDAFIFLTYLYATTFFGLPLVSDKAILVPTAHEEPYLYFPIYRPIFHLPQMIVYNTETERRTVSKATQNHHIPNIVAGVGINVSPDASAVRFQQKYGIKEPFILYVGRINEAKNVPELMTHFGRFRQENDNPVKLVLIGKTDISLPDHPDIVPLGFVSEQDKFDAICAAAVVVMPSLYESLSMLALEAWWMERPMLVNGRCEVLKQQCQRSNGGLYYFTYDEFAMTLKTLLETAELRHKLGQQGHLFVAQYYTWDIILDKYSAILTNIINP